MSVVYPEYELTTSQFSPVGDLVHITAISVDLDTEAVTLSAAFGCNGAVPTVAYSVGPAATDLGSAITLANNLRAALIACGICK